ncbi:MAG: ATP-binding protein, partial [Aureliella sp.]
MAQPKHDRLRQELHELKLVHIAENYREVLDEAARKNTPMLDILMQLVGGQSAARRDGAMARRVRIARLPALKRLEDYDFTFPTKIPKSKLLRLFDCQFVDAFGCAVLIGGTGVGKTPLL